ncbi:MAG TPA: YIP1 family protein [Anaerolineales bacterium]|nr:YIP1 family protein [Anaerolineales bacterium]HNO30598.1 YIP1 family protein [Anaerolineales bacterium]
MTDTTETKQPGRFQFARILEVLFQPNRTLTMLAEEGRSSWQTPMLALSLSAALSVIISGVQNSRAAQMGEIQLPRDWQWWTPDMQNNYMQAQQSMQGPVFTYIIPLAGALLSLWLGWLILGGLLHLGSTVFGGRGSMQTALTITGWASLPYLVRDVLRIVFMLIVGHSIQSPGISGFVENSPFWAALLSHMDVFFIWVLLLLIIGFGASDNMPRIKAVANVLIVSLLLLLVQAGIGAALSGASGLAIQRPFF